MYSYGQFIEMKKEEINADIEIIGASESVFVRGNILCRREKDFT